MISPKTLLTAAVSALGFVCFSCARPQSFGTAPSTPVSSDTDLADTGASRPDPGVKPPPARIDTGIDPYADKKNPNR